MSPGLLSETFSLEEYPDLNKKTLKHFSLEAAALSHYIMVLEAAWGQEGGAWPQQQNFIQQEMNKTTI